MTHMLIDTHCHMDYAPLVDDIEAVKSRAIAADVRKIITPGVDEASWRKVRDIADHETFFPAFGLHPWMSDDPLDIDRLETLLIEEKAVAIGEIGLDFKIDNLNKDHQIEVFHKQVQLAQKLDLPVLLHNRNAFDEMVEILSDFDTPVRGVLHAFSRGKEIAKKFLDLNLFLAFGGAVTRANAKRPKKGATFVPDENLLIETDAPAIALEDIAPIHVEPRHTRDVATALAEIRQTSLESIASITTKNAEKLFQFQ